MKIGRVAPRRRRQIHSEIDLAKPVSKKRALLVGISYQKKGGSSELKGPHKDVRAMKGLLIDKYGYHDGDMTILLDDGKDKNKQPTKENLLREMSEFLNDARRGDRFFFHYAGHVHQGDEDPNSKEEDKREEYIVPCDADPNDPRQEACIQDDVLKKLLVDRLPVGAHLVAVFDSCHSQSLLDLEHWRCNRVYVPWISKGRRKSDSMWNNVQRKAAIRTRTIQQNTRVNEEKVKSRKATVDQLHFDPKSVLNTQSHPHSCHQHDPVASFSSHAPSLSHASLSSSSQNSSRPYSPPGTPRPSVLPIRTSFPQPLVPTVPNTPTSPNRTKTVTFTLSPTATINSVSLKLKRKATGVINLAKRDSGITPRGSVTTGKKKLSLKTEESVFRPWLTSPFKACNTEDIIKGTPREKAAEEELCLMESPQQEYCSGNCREEMERTFADLAAQGKRDGGEKERESSEGEGDVISLSSCRDNQLAWESADGTSMTQFLVRQLRKQTHPSLAHLMAGISHDLHKSAVDMHRQTKAYKKSWVDYRKKKKLAKPRTASDTHGLEMNNFQNPELSSRKPLDMRRPWNM
ncbi:hypothetical protein VKT23_014099 [Stygiomarasmius scandens]|uniref:Peptidase C14 caspase domain-containing protein n=1 Tax=Marasmiellus scandens TaxID=2682957 RepID=A0ABR1J4U1_9AGAR